MQIREYHRRHPAARVVDANEEFEGLLKEEPQIEFSGEVPFALYFFIHSISNQMFNCSSVCCCPMKVITTNALHFSFFLWSRRTLYIHSNLTRQSYEEYIELFEEVFCWACNLGKLA